MSQGSDRKVVDVNNAACELDFNNPTDDLDPTERRDVENLIDEEFDDIDNGHCGSDHDHDHDCDDNDDDNGNGNDKSSL